MRRPARCARCSRKRSQTQFESRTGLARVAGRRTKSFGTRERDNWGQLYLYDLHDREAEAADHDRRRPVTQIARVDEKTRTIWFGANGREKGQDPYFRHFYRIGLDGKSAGRR